MYGEGGKLCVVDVPCSSKKVHPTLACSLREVSRSEWLYEHWQKR